MLLAWAGAAWEFEITESDGKAITVGVVIGLFLLLFGYLVSLPGIAGRLVMAVGLGSAMLLRPARSVMLYRMLVALFFVSLDVANVLTFLLSSGVPQPLAGFEVRICEYPHQWLDSAS